MTAAALAVIGSFSAPALACTCGGPGTSQFRVSDDGRIPANALGVLWETDFVGLEPTDNVWVEQVDGEVRTRVEFTVEMTLPGLYLIQPANWTEGNTYRVHAEVPERDELKGFIATERIREVWVEVGPPVDDSISAGLNVYPQIQGVFSVEAGSACLREFDGVGVDMNMNVYPFPTESFVYTTYVDGEVWARQSNYCVPVGPGTSWVGLGRDRLVADCGADPQNDGPLGLGTHTVYMEARLPGTDLVWTTDTKTVELSCPEPTTATSECEDSSGGCQTVGAPSTWLALLSLLGLMGWRTRRRREIL
ncbi:MAG: hypothetical protein R3E66_01875 [bacterium]